MPKISKTGSTPMQRSYALRVWGAKGKDKKAIAMDVGYSAYVARSATSKIENTKGFHNALQKLANDSNNMALSVMEEFKARGLKGFSNKDLVAALNAIAGAWSKFNNEEIKSSRPQSDSGNRLKTIVQNRIEHQTITNITEGGKVVKVDDIDLDF